MNIRGLMAMAVIFGVMAALFAGVISANLNLKGVQVAAETSSSDGSSDGASHDWTVFV